MPDSWRWFCVPHASEKNIPGAVNKHKLGRQYFWHRQCGSRFNNNALLADEKRKVIALSGLHVSIVHACGRVLIDARIWMKPETGRPTWSARHTYGDYAVHLHRRCTGFWAVCHGPYCWRIKQWIFKSAYTCILFLVSDWSVAIYDMLKKEKTN